MHLIQLHEKLAWMLRTVPTSQVALRVATGEVRGRILASLPIE